MAWAFEEERSALDWQEWYLLSRFGRSEVAAGGRRSSYARHLVD